MPEIASILRPVRDSNRGRIYRVGFAATNLATNFSLTQKLYWKMRARKSSPDSLSRPPASLDRPRCHGSRAHGARRRCGAGNGRWHGRVHDWTAGIHTGCSRCWQEPGGEPPGSRPDGPASRPAHGCCQTPDGRGGKSDRLGVSARRERPPPVNDGMHRQRSLLPSPLIFASRARLTPNGLFWGAGRRCRVVRTRADRGTAKPWPEDTRAPALHQCRRQPRQERA